MSGSSVLKMKRTIPCRRNGSDTEKLDRLVVVLEKLVQEQFTGSVKVHLSQGGISRIEKLEEILK